MPERVHYGWLPSVGARVYPAGADAIWRSANRKARKLFAVGDPTRLWDESVFGFDPDLYLSVCGQRRAPLRSFADPITTS